MKMLFKIILCVLPIISFGQESKEKEKIDSLLTAWHEAAANADFDGYFSKMTNDAVFIGTDATENWQNAAFKTFSKPYFNKGKAWSFYALERNIYLSQNEEIAWFDELLNTQMKICRGSGVLRKVNGKWLIAHYVLSIAVPNEVVSDLVKLKATRDSIIIKTLSTHQ